MELKQKLFHPVEEHENDELWAISYGDMITLLLSFFVLFFSIDIQKKEQAHMDEKTEKEKKMETMDNHLISSFKKIPDLQKSTFQPSTEVPGKGKKFTEAPKFELFKKAKITKINDRLIVTFDTMNFFNTAETEVNKKGKSLLSEFAKSFVPYAGLYKVNIKAFTDNRPVKKKHRFKDNMELSVLRALSAMRTLQSAGIPLNRMELGGYGEMDKLHTVVELKEIKKLSGKKIQDLSRTIIIIIKHDNEQSLL